MGFHLIGVQESRLPRGTMPAGMFRVISSGRENYNLGCSLLVRKELPCYQRDGKKLEISPKRLKTPVQQPRLLVVRLKVPRLYNTLAVARAPHSRASDDAVGSYE